MWLPPRRWKNGYGAGRRIMKSGGALTLIWRADGLTEVLAALGRGFGSLAILPVHGDAETPAIRVLVRAIKGGRAPTKSMRRWCSMISQPCPINRCATF